MPNANEDMAVAQQVDAATEPIDLAQAFRALNQINREAAQKPMEAGDMVEGTEPGEAQGAATGEPSVNEVEEGGAAPATDESGNGAVDDGFADGIEAIDFNAYKQQMLRDIQNDSANEVRREFSEQNIGYYSMAELTVRDEQTGRVMFRNPDVQDERDPNYYFNSRSELQQFVEAWNKGVDFEFRKAVNEKQREKMNQATPAVRLIDFMPKWNAMDENTRSIFDDLLEGHEINDANGKVIGFNVNLDAVAAQAERIAKRFPAQVPQAQETSQQKPASTGSNGPALDLATGNGESEDEAEPKNIGEALKMFDKKNRGGK